MNNTKLAKHFWLWLLLAVVVEFAAITLWKRWYWFFPSLAVSEEYSRYKDVDGIRAAFLKDYRVNDTVTVDITLLEAANDAGWDILQHDFYIPVVPKEYEHLYCGDSNKISIKTINKKHPALPVDTVDGLNNNIMYTSRPRRFICILKITDSAQIKAVSNMSYEYNISNNPNKTNSNTWLRKAEQSKR
ncbi:MAG: hypothetical protein J6X62_05450 [Bacteroidales bacterium]|nr:hypothetical protein [Bacteroidales bacterium]